MSYADRYLDRELTRLVECWTEIAAKHREEAEVKPRTGLTETDFGRGLLVGDAIGMEHCARSLSSALERFVEMKDRENQADREGAA